MADRNGFMVAKQADDAGRLALCFLRANAAANGREDAQFVNRLQRGVDIVHKDVPDEGGNIDTHRATADAVRHQALDTALGLAVGVSRRVAQVDLFEVCRALVGVAFGHWRLMRVHFRTFL